MKQAGRRRLEAGDREFREAVGDVQPIAPSNRVLHARAKPQPIPAKRREDEQAVLDELAHLTFDDDFEIEDDSSYLRPGLPRDILRKLRRTHWVVQAHLDLQPARSVAMHFGTIQLTLEGIDEPLRALEAALRAKSIPAERFQALPFGDSIRVGERD